jgi:hypothetical protein
MIRTDTAVGSWFVHLVAEIFGRSEVGFRLGSGALLLLLDLDLVVALSCLIWFGWPPCSYFLVALLLLLISSWWSSMWPWWLIALLGFLWCYFESCSWCSWDKVRRDGGACGVCGCLWWCLSSLSAKLSFVLLTFWSKPRCACLSWMVNYFGYCHL